MDDVDNTVSSMAQDAQLKNFTSPQALPGAIEALTLVSTEPLTVDRAFSIMQDAGFAVSRDDVVLAFSDVKSRWQNDSFSSSGVCLVEVASGLAFRTHHRHAHVVEQFLARPKERMSRALMETLAVIAYRQPVTRLHIEEIRGVDCARALRKLVETDLVRVIGKSDELGRPLLYATTKHFLEVFSLASLTELPTLADFGELRGGISIDKINTELDAEFSGSLSSLLQLAKTDGAVTADTEASCDDALSHLDIALAQATKAVARIAQNGDGSAVASDGLVGEHHDN